MSDRADTNLASRLHVISQAVAAVAVLTGLLVLISWLLDLPGLNRIHPVLGGMNSHTAICFVLAGTSLWLLNARQSAAWKVRIAHVAAGVVVLIGVLTLSTSFGWGFGIDDLSQGAIGQIFPGRMPVATALAFLAIGLALLLLDVEVWRCPPAEIVSFAAALISLLALIAFSYSFVSFFDIPNRRSLAFHTVLLLLALSIGILAARPRRGLMFVATSHDAAGVMVRRLLPAAVGIPVLVGWVISEGQRAGFYPPVLNLAYYTVAIIVVFSTLIWLTTLSLHRLGLERQHAEEQVRRLNAELEQRVVERTAQLENANRELEAFSYSVSHDLRAPLRAIDGFSAIVLQDHAAALGPEGQGHLERVRVASCRMRQLIDDLLDLSRVTRNPMKRTPLDVSALAHEVVADLRRGAPGHQVDVVIGPNLRADADPNLMRIVLENLLGNAWKFTRNTPHPRIEVGAIRRDDRTVFFVCDNGAGFDMAYAAKLFGAFQRLHREQDYEGTGIGLATVQRIIHRHGGKVWAEGAVGRGATFYFVV